MVGTFKEKPNGGYYCSECRMSFGEPHEVCEYCGSIVTNYEDIIVRANLNTNPPSPELSYEDDLISEFARVMKSPAVKEKLKEIVR